VPALLPCPITMPTTISPEDGREMFTSFEPASEYHGGKGAGEVERKFLCGMYYKGRYEDDHENGWGKWTTESGHTYEGNWKDGKQHGHGKYTTSSGSVYEGEWVGGKKEGQGCYTLAPLAQVGTREYRGAFETDQRHGWGVYTAQSPTCSGILTYAGEWWRDKQTGRGYGLSAQEPGCCDLMASALDISRFDDGKKVGEGVRWMDPAKIVRNADGSHSAEYRDPAGSRVRLPKPLYYGPWRLEDGVDVGEIDEAAAQAIAKRLGLTVPTFPFVPPAADPAPDTASTVEGEEGVKEGDDEPEAPSA